MASRRFAKLTTGACAALVVPLLAAAGAGGIAVADAQSPKRGGTVVVLRDPRVEPTCLNPFACSILEVDPALTQVLEGAFEARHDLEPRPNLVSRVDIGRKPFTLTYRIRPEARWSDGVSITAFDFLFTQRAFARLDLLADPDDTAKIMYRKIRHTRVLDAKTFRIELREPFAAWRNLYPIVLPRHALAGRDLTRVWIDRIDNPRTGAPIGSGPFLVRGFERGKDLTLVRNPRYWGPHTAYLDRFVIRFAKQDPQDPLGPLRRDEFDVALFLGGAFITAETAAQVRQAPGWRVAAWPGTAMEHLAFRIGPGGHPALRSSLVRRALAFGIDRVAIAQEIQAEAEPSIRRPMDSAVFLPSEPFYRPSWSRYRYDPDRAQSLLRQAGCRRGSDGVYSCEGERLALRFITTAVPVRALTLRLIQAQLRRAGVDVQVTFVASIGLVAQLLSSGAADAALFAWVAAGGVVWPEVSCHDPQNWSGFCSRLVQRDIQQTEVILEPRQRARALNAVDSKLALAVPVLPIVQPLLRTAIRDTVRGVIAGGAIFEITQNSEDWWLAAPR